MRPFSLIVSHIPPWCDRDGLVDLSQPFMCHILITCLHLTLFEVVESVFLHPLSCSLINRGQYIVHIAIVLGVVVIDVALCLINAQVMM